MIKGSFIPIPSDLELQATPLLRFHDDDLIIHIPQAKGKTGEISIVAGKVRVKIEISYAND